MVVSSVNKKIPVEQRLPYIQRVVDAHVDSTAPVDLDNPQVTSLCFIISLL